MDRPGERRGDRARLLGGQRNRFGVIPERPLKANATYRVTYTYRRDGEPETASATFSTN